MTRRRRGGAIPPRLFLFEDLKGGWRMMERPTNSALAQAAALLLDALLEAGDVSVEVPVAGVAEAALTQLLSAVHEEASRRGWGILVEPTEAEEPCLLLRRR
jgi:hypothetical protein